MASVTFAIDDSMKSKIDKLSWINWSEVARTELLEEEGIQKKLDKFRKIISKSRLTEKDADDFSEKAKNAMLKKLQEERLV